MVKALVPSGRDSTSVEVRMEGVDRWLGSLSRQFGAEARRDSARRVETPGPISRLIRLIAFVEMPEPVSPQRPVHRTLCLGLDLYCGEMQRIRPSRRSIPLSGRVPYLLYNSPNHDSMPVTTILSSQTSLLPIPKAVSKLPIPL